MNSLYGSEAQLLFSHGIHTLDSVSVLLSCLNVHETEGAPHPNVTMSNHSLM